MRTLFTTSAAISPVRSPLATELESLPAPPTERFRAHECGAAFLLLMGSLHPASAPVLLAIFFTLSLWHGVTAARTERAYVRLIERLTLHHTARLGRGHPLSVTLRRYHRLLCLLLLSPPDHAGMKGTARRWALAMRLHHRCQHLLQYPDYLLPGPRDVRPQPGGAPTWLPNLAQRARQRRLGRLRHV